MPSTPRPSSGSPEIRLLGLATALPPADIAEAGRRLKAVGDELATLEDEWLRLSGEIADQAILDALKAFDGPVIEVHISNVHQREGFRHHSYVSLRADGVIAGCGTEGYLLALRRVASLPRG